MTFRRAVAFTATILILRLGFVAGESRCIPGHDAGKAPIPSQHHKQHAENPTAPNVPVCCQALTSCAIAVDVNSNDVILQDNNRWSYRVFNRLDNTAPGEELTPPKRLVMRASAFRWTSESYWLR